MSPSDILRFKVGMRGAFVMDRRGNLWRVLDRPSIDLTRPASFIVTAVDAGNGIVTLEHRHDHPDPS